MTRDHARPPASLPPPKVVVAFHLTDSDESFHVIADQGVSRVVPGSPDRADATVQLPQRVWLALLLGLTSLGEALLADGVEAEGDLAKFVRFHRRFATAVSPRRPRRGEPE